MIWALLIAEKGGVLDGALKGAAKGAITGAIGGLILGIIFLVKKWMQKNPKDKDDDEPPTIQEVELK